MSDHPTRPAEDARADLRTAAGARPSQPLLLLIGGPPASGKTRVAEALGQRAALITLHKDAFKEPLMTEMGVQSVEDSARLGDAAVVSLFVAGEAVLERGCDVILESTFSRRDLDRVAALQAAHGCATLHVHVTAATDELVRRWQARVGRRHPGHLDAERLPELRQRVEAGTWDPPPFDAPLLRIDTSPAEPFDVDVWLDEVRRSSPAAATP